MSASDNSRMFELVNELVGAQTVAKLVEEVVANLKPEHKEALAIAICAQATKLIQGGDWSVRDGLNKVIERVATKVFEERSSEIEERVRALASQMIEREVKIVMQQRLEKAVREVTDRLRFTT